MILCLGFSFGVCKNSKFPQITSVSIYTFYQTVGVQSLFVNLAMAPKIARNRADTKGKSKVFSSSNVTENAFSLIDDEVCKFFEEKCKERLKS